MIASTGLLASRKEPLAYPIIAMQSSLKFSGCPMSQSRSDWITDRTKPGVLSAATSSCARPIEGSALSRRKLPT